MPIFDPLTPSVAGRAPHDASGKAQGPYGFASANRNASGGLRGVSLGAGLLNGDLGQGATGSVLSGNLNMGGWRSPDGKTNWGLAGDAQLVRTGINPGGALGPLGFDVGVFTASGGASVNDTTAQLGAQANIIEGSASIGNQEHLLRVGGSVGVGLAGRAHYGDADGDGVRELGFGFDVGPFSMDVKSELLGHAWNGISSGAGWVGRQAGRAWDAITSW
jgi:hypothetical protein